MSTAFPRLLFHSAAIAAMVAGLTACDRVQSSPKLVTVDGQSHLACHGLVWVDTANGMFAHETEYKISFTDAGDMQHTIWGAKHVSVADLPPYEMVPMPDRLPDPEKEIDMNGKAYVNGQTYSWPDGSKANLVGGKWQPVPAGTVCK